MENKIDIPCLIALLFIGASLYTTISQCKPCEELKQNLDPTQLEIYSDIVKERLYNYYIGLILGIVLALIYYKYGRNVNVNVNGNSNANSNVNNSEGNNINGPLGNRICSICIYLAIILSTQFLYYMLVPKSKYMLDYLNGDQIKLWLETYKTMRNKYYFGALFGIIAYFILMFMYY